MTILQGTSSNLFFAENLEPVAEFIILLSDREYEFGKTDDGKTALYKSDRITQSRFVVTRSQISALIEDLENINEELDKLEEKVKTSPKN